MEGRGNANRIPAVMRSKLMLEVASELVSDRSWENQPGSAEALAVLLVVDYDGVGGWVAVDFFAATGRLGPWKATNGPWQEGGNHACGRL